MAGNSKSARKGWKTRNRDKTLALAEKKLAKRKDFETALAEANATAVGSSYVSGIRTSLMKIDEEYVPALKDLRGRLDILRQMATGDAKVASQIRANVLPLWSAVRFKAVGGSQEMRDLVSSNLLREGDPRFWCTTSWMQRLLEKCMCLRDGFAFHAKTREDVDGYKIFRELTYLEPRSFGGPKGAWEWDKSGKLVAIHRSFKEPMSQVLVPDERIPVSELSASIWWHVGENWEGMPLIRPMYGAWKKKDLASKIAMIALLNGGVGIPMATLGPNDGNASRTALMQMASDLRQGSKERSFLVLANGQKMEFLTTNGSIIDARPMLAEQNMEMASAGATEFLQSGQTSGGSRANSSVMMVAYMQQVEAFKVWLVEQLNHGAGYLQGEVEELCRMNSSNPADWCKIVGSAISPTEQLDNVPLLGDMVQKGAVRPTFSLNNEILDRLGFPISTEADYIASQPASSTGGRPNEVGNIDRQDPRDDKMAGYGMRESWHGGVPPLRSKHVFPWQKSMRA